MRRHRSFWRKCHSCQRNLHQGRQLASQKCKPGSHESTGIFFPRTSSSLGSSQLNAWKAKSHTSQMPCTFFHRIFLLMQSDLCINNICDVLLENYSEVNVSQFHHIVQEIRRCYQNILHRHRTPTMIQCNFEIPLHKENSRPCTSHFLRIGGRNC